MEQLVNSLATIIITQLVKLNKKIPAITEGMKTKLRIIVAVLSFLTTGLTYYMNGTIDKFIESPDFKTGLVFIINAGIVFAGSHLGYKGLGLLKFNK